MRGYEKVTTPMEKLLKKYVKFQWNEKCQESLDVLKNNMVTKPILIFPYWKIDFHVHVDASAITLGVVLSQPREGSIDNPIAISSRKISTT